MRVLAFLLLASLALPALAQRPQAALECRPTPTDFVYDCTIHLRRGGKPLSGVEVTVGADMPSMPMAHNVKPAQAQAGDRPGDYRVMLDLEMLGDWTVKLRLAGPVRDLLLLDLNFDEKGTRPARRRR